MTDFTIFVVGFFIMLLLSGTVGLLLRAAVEDGRYDREYKKQHAGNGPPNSNEPQNVQ
jgi:hypothetical protein